MISMITNLTKNWLLYLPYRSERHLIGSYSGPGTAEVVTTDPMRSLTHITIIRCCEVRVLGGSGGHLCSCCIVIYGQFFVVLAL